MEQLIQIIQTTFNSFDFMYCLIVNILTFIAIKIIDEINKEKPVGTWTKRIVLLCAILLTGVVYYLLGEDLKLLINSAILAPVAWDMIIKPAMKVLGIDYRKIDGSK